MKFTTKQLNTLRSTYGSLQTMTISDFERLKLTLSKLDNDQLEQLAKSGVKFIRTAANSLLVDRGVYPADARIDHAVDCITESLRLQTA